MTAPSLPALPPHLYRSECFAEDLDDDYRARSTGRSHRHFPFPIAPYPAVPMSVEQATTRLGRKPLPTTRPLRSLRRAVACVALAATLPGSAWAALISYEYAGVVDYDEAGRGWISFSGQLAFDSAAPDQIADPSSADYKISSSPQGNWPNGFNVTFNTGQSASFNHYLDILVSNNLGGTDQWGAQAHDSGSPDSLGLTLTDFSQSAFASDALPLPAGGLTLAMFGLSEFKYESADGLLSGHLTDLRCVSGCGAAPDDHHVPEPQSLALVLAGLGAGWLMAHRRLG